MPAAAVIPAPRAYIKVVAVKKLVVELWAWLAGVHRSMSDTNLFFDQFCEANLSLFRFALYKTRYSHHLLE